VKETQRENGSNHTPSSGSRPQQSNSSYYTTVGSSITVIYRPWLGLILSLVFISSLDLFVFIFQSTLSPAARSSATRSA
jgi:hypothetical protein